MNKTVTTLAYAAGMGAIAGMRSMSAPALLSRRLAQRKRSWAPLLSRSPAVRLLSSRRSATVLTLLAAGEMVGDKTPFVPRRTEWLPLAGRAMAGALSGTVIAARRGSSQPAAAVLGAAAAVAATHLAYRLRKEAGEVTGVPDVVFALVEDAVVLTAGSHIAAAVA